MKQIHILAFICLLFKICETKLICMFDCQTECSKENEGKTTDPNCIQIATKHDIQPSYCLEYSEAICSPGCCLNDHDWKCNSKFNTGYWPKACGAQEDCKQSNCDPVVKDGQCLNSTKTTNPKNKCLGCDKSKSSDVCGADDACVDKSISQCGIIIPLGLTKNSGSGIVITCPCITVIICGILYFKKRQYDKERRALGVQNRFTEHGEEDGELVVKKNKSSMQNRFTEHGEEDGELVVKKKNKSSMQCEPEGKVVVKEQNNKREERKNEIIDQQQILEEQNKKTANLEDQNQEMTQLEIQNQKMTQLEMQNQQMREKIDQLEQENNKKED